MQKIVAIADALIAAKVVQRERIEVGAERGSVQPSFSLAGPDLLLYRLTYTGIIDIAAGIGPLEDVLAQVVLWIQENGDPEHDELVEWEGEPEDKHRASATLLIALEEAVRYIPADAGYAGRDKITYHGEDWKREAGAADTATTLEPAEGGVTTSTEAGP